MIKSILPVAALVAFAFAAAPAFAADCAEGMKTSNEMMMKMTDAAKMEMAKKEMTMAREAMDKKDEAGCMMHMDMMNKAMK